MPIWLWIILGVLAIYIAIRLFLAHKCSYCWNIFTKSQETEWPQDGAIYIHIDCPRCGHKTERNLPYLSMGNHND